MFSKAQDSVGKERRLKCELIAIVEGEQAHPMSSIGLGTCKRWNLLASMALSITPLCEPACGVICIWDGWMDGALVDCWMDGLFAPKGQGCRCSLQCHGRATLKGPKNQK
jgi:hypothetical protein